MRREPLAQWKVLTIATLRLWIPVMLSKKKGEVFCMRSDTTQKKIILVENMKNMEIQ